MSTDDPTEIDRSLPKTESEGAPGATEGLQPKEGEGQAPNPEVTDAKAFLLAMMRRWSDGLQTLHQALHGDSQTLSTAYLGRRINKLASDVDELRGIMAEVVQRQERLEAVHSVGNLEAMDVELKRLRREFGHLGSRIELAARMLRPLIEAYATEHGMTVEEYRRKEGKHDGGATEVKKI